MTAKTATVQRVEVSPETINRAAQTPLPAGVTVHLQAPSGVEIQLEKSVQRMLLETLHAVAEHGAVTVGRVPSELTSTAAAELLSVSRPTLMKWVREGVIASHKVGTHTRFRRDDVLRLRAERAERRREAFHALRALEAEQGVDLEGAVIPQTVE